MRATAGVLAAMSILLAGCADDGGSAADRGPLQKPEVLSVHQGLPPGVPAAGGAPEPVAVILARTRVALATWGSSTCPYTPLRMKATGPDDLRLVLDIPGSERVVCTADLGPSTVRLGVDPAMTRDGTLDVLLSFPDKHDAARVVARPVSARLRDER